jgi:hypothetical protein
MPIVDDILGFLPAKKKNTPSGWIKFNAVCCEHNGQTKDRRARAGLIVNGDGVSYHCFNCGFKSSYQDGRHLTRKMRQLLSWLGLPDDLISKMALEALRNKDAQESVAKTLLPDFPDKELPADTVSAGHAPPEVREYLALRGFSDLDEYQFLWSPEYSDRFIIPFLYQGRLVGWTARKVTDGKPKYISDQSPGYVFNLDEQPDDHTHVLVVEGPMDALSIGGVALLGAEISDVQHRLISRLGKEITLVPDRDSSGRRTAEQALDKGWAVSLPEWPDGCKDANDAVRIYGRLTTLALIFKHRETNPVKARVLIKSWFSNDDQRDN